MKKAYLIIIYSITLICVVVGLAINIFNGFSFIPFNSVSSEAESFSEEITAVEDDLVITIDSRIGNVKVEKGDEFHLTYNSLKILETKVEYTANSISVIQQSKVTNWGNNKGADITLTIPEGVHIVKLDVHNDLGDIKILDINADEMRISENLGDVVLDKCTFKDGDISNDLGDIKLLSCSDFTNYTMKLDVSLGEIKCYDNKYGDEYNSEGTDGTLTVSNSLGDITIK